MTVCSILVDTISEVLGSIKQYRPIGGETIFNIKAKGHEGHLHCSTQ